MSDSKKMKNSMLNKLVDIKCAFMWTRVSEHTCQKHAAVFFASYSLTKLFVEYVDTVFLQV